MIAFQFPPVSGTSGVQRTLRFVRYLPAFGWQPVVLTAHPRAYKFVSDDQLGDVPDDVEVIRAPAWDAGRHLSLAGRYPRFLANPDRFVSWWPGAVWQGLRAIRQSRFDAIWSTYPIPTAHTIGASLAKRSGLPWIADFRDPMAQDDYPVDLKKRERFARIEQDVVDHARFSTFTTPGALAMYRERYPQHAAAMQLLENGYDEETFDGAQDTGPLVAGRLTLLHSGVVYPVERDPTRFFEAVGELKHSDPDLYARLNVRFRAPFNDDMLRDLSARCGVEDVIEILPPIDYRDALQEMCSADALLVLQAANCNSQIPAKLYEYLRARRPLLVLTDPDGDTATATRAAGVDAIAKLDDKGDILALLRRFLQHPNAGTLPTDAAIAAASRRERTHELAQLLDRALKVG